MRLLDDAPMDPEVAAALDAIDSTLAGEPVDPGMPSSPSLRCCWPTSGPASIPCSPTRSMSEWRGGSARPRARRSARPPAPAGPAGWPAARRSRWRPASPPCSCSPRHPHAGSSGSSSSARRPRVRSRRRHRAGDRCASCRRASKPQSRDRQRRVESGLCSRDHGVCRPDAPASGKRPQDHPVRPAQPLHLAEPGRRRRAGGLRRGRPGERDRQPLVRHPDRTLGRLGVHAAQRAELGAGPDDDQAVAAHLRAGVLPDRQQPGRQQPIRPGQAPARRCPGASHLVAQAAGERRHDRAGRQPQGPDPRRRAIDLFRRVRARCAEPPHRLQQHLADDLRGRSAAGRRPATTAAGSRSARPRTTRGACWWCSPA